MQSNLLGNRRLRVAAFARGASAWVWLAAWLILLLAEVNAQRSSQASTSVRPIFVLAPDVEKAVLAEDWTKVAGELESVNPASGSAVLRMLKGHACLALNRNNESLGLFASVLRDNGVDAWRAWADDFGNEQRYAERAHKAIVWYFKGDAHARQKQWQLAIRCFDKALKLDKKCYLAWNARGVVEHAVGNTLTARVYFKAATDVKTDFADAYASRGTASIYSASVKRDPDKGPEFLFNQARLYSTDKNPLLALMGLGCASSGKQDYQEARRYFDAVPKASDLGPLAQRNALITETVRLGDALNRASHAGMSIQSLQATVAQQGAFGAKLEEQLGHAHLALNRPPDWQIWILIGVLGGEAALGPLRPGEHQPDEPAPPPVVQPGPTKPVAGQGPPPGSGGKDGGKDGGKEGEKDGDGSKTKEATEQKTQDTPPSTSTVPPELLPVVVVPPRPKEPVGDPIPPRPKEPVGDPIPPRPKEPVGDPIPPRPKEPVGDPIPPRPKEPVGDPIPPRPDRWQSRSLAEIAVLTRAIEATTARVEQRIAADASRLASAEGLGAQPSAQPGMGKYGGVDADVGSLPTNRGQWGVCNLYGLLYAVSLKLPESPANPSKGRN
jgi:tetratricopeptide (TPR) repeat protein